MNHLAHFHLAWPREQLVIGGLEGDFHRGALPGSLNPGIAEGVALHRAIDAYTDRHELLAEARGLFPEGTRRFAGIMMDLLFDHFLSLHWTRFSDVEHRHFCQEVYAILERGHSQLSAPARRFAAWLAQHDALMRYRHWEAVPASALRTGRRLSRDNPLSRAGDILQPLAPELEQVFLVFYPELIGFCASNAKLASR